MCARPPPTHTHFRSLSQHTNLKKYTTLHEIHPLETPGCLQHKPWTKPPRLSHSSFRDLEYICVYIDIDMHAGF